MMIDRYEVIRQLSSGGMSDIFLARSRDPPAGRLVIIKRILPGLCQKKQFNSMFRAEARVAMSLNHPNIARVHEAGQEGEVQFLVMEFVHGADLHDIMRNTLRPLAPPHAALIGARVASALFHIHCLTDSAGAPQRVVHRDIKPRNIRVSHAGVVKLLDFGIVKAASNTHATRQGVIKGTYTYMSPEQVKGLELDGRSDVFSLGVVMWEMLTGQNLFRRKNEMESMKAIVEDLPITRPSSISRQPVPAELDQIVLGALERDRERRFADARELQQALLSFLQVRPAQEAELVAFVTGVAGNARDHGAQLLSSGGSVDLDSLPTTVAEDDLPTTLAEGEETRAETEAYQTPFSRGGGGPDESS